MSNDSEQPPEKDARETEYPSSPGADENPQEPVSEEEFTESGQQEESEQERSGGGDDDGGAGQGAEADGDGQSSGAAESGEEEPEGPPENYPSDPEETKSDPPHGSGGGPGAAKASEPHERRHNVPPLPSRPPSNSGNVGQWPGPDPAPPTSAWQAAPYQQPPPRRTRKKTSKAPLFLGIGVAAALVVGVVLIATMLSGTGETEAEPAPDSNGIIAEEVSPFDFEEGQCFTDFSNATEPATVVTCQTPHKAQLVNTFHYEEDAEFPGEEALGQKAEELCRNTQLSEEASRYEGELRQQTAYPQTESWQEGDRRVDCFIRITNGEITGSLIG